MVSEVPGPSVEPGGQPAGCSHRHYGAARMTEAALAPAVGAVRLTLHVLAAAVWVGGQLTVAGLLPTLRRCGEDVPRRAARAFARLGWPAYALLVGTGIWNVVTTAPGQPAAWRVVLGVKTAVVLIAGVAVWLHGRARRKAWIGAWGALGGLASVAALVMGVFLAG